MGVVPTSERGERFDGMGGSRVYDGMNPRTMLRTSSSAV
jgi:hypothetical protein